MSETPSIEVIRIRLKEIVLCCYYTNVRRVDSLRYDEVTKWLHTEGMVNGELFEDDFYHPVGGLMNYDITEKGVNLLNLLEL